MIRLVMTLLVRDEEDIVRDNIEFHLNHGVDFIIATDNGSTDGTREILAEYQRIGLLRLYDELRQDYSQWKWVTRMAFAARDEFGADWILNNDADEFWYPESGDLKTELSGTPVNMLICRRRNMLAPHDQLNGSSWASTLTYYTSTPLPVPALDNPLSTPLPAPYFYLDLPPKALCRARGLQLVHQGNHSATYDEPSSAESGNILIRHFPVRSRDQLEAKVRQGGDAYARNKELDPSVGWHWRRWHKKLLEEGLDSVLHEALPCNAAAERDFARGRLSTDTLIAESFRTDHSRMSRSTTVLEDPIRRQSLDPVFASKLARFLAGVFGFSSLIQFACGDGSLLNAVKHQGREGLGVETRMENGPNPHPGDPATYLYRDVRLPVFVGRADLVLYSGEIPNVQDRWAATLADTLVRASSRHIIVGPLTGASGLLGPPHDDTWGQRFARRGFFASNELTSRLMDFLVSSLPRSTWPDVSPFVLTRSSDLQQTSQEVR